MPISHKYKLLFIHIPKNGGKSFEIFFDIHNQYSGSPNSRSLLNRAAKFLLSKSTKKASVQNLMGVIDKSYAAQHLTLQEIILGNWVNNDILERYYKVAIIRDPYDRAFSLFNHWSSNIKSTVESIEQDFFDFLSKIDSYRKSSDHNLASHFKKQVDFLKNLNGEITNIELLHLEKINEDVANFVKKINLTKEKSLSFPINKESDNKLRDNSKSERNLEKVYDLFREDYELLGYNINQL